MKDLPKNKSREFLRSSGLKSTPTRISVLEIFTKSKVPLNADQVLRKLGEDNDKVTVYRTLNSFKEKGIIKKVDLRKDSAYFELSEKHKHYIVCLGCGLIEDFDMCFMSKISKRVLDSSSRFKRINDHSLELFGTCIPCSRKTKKTKKI